MSTITQTLKKPKTKNHETTIPPRPRPRTDQGHTIIDVLIARALVAAYLDEDYTDVITQARLFANFVERRVST